MSDNFRFICYVVVSFALMQLTLVGALLCMALDLIIIVLILQELEQQE
jgi:hypothetical protein